MSPQKRQQPSPYQPAAQEHEACHQPENPRVLGVNKNKQTHKYTWIWTLKKNIVHMKLISNKKTKKTCNEFNYYLFLNLSTQVFLVSQMANSQPNPNFYPLFVELKTKGFQQNKIKINKDPYPSEVVKLYMGYKRRLSSPLRRRTSNSFQRRLQSDRIRWRRSNPSSAADSGASSRYDGCKSTGPIFYLASNGLRPSSRFFFSSSL